MPLRYAAVVAACAVAVVAPADAFANPATVSLDDPEPALEQDGDDWKTSVGLTNLTTGAVRVNVTSDRANCELSVVAGRKDPVATVEAALHEKITVFVAKGCAADDGVFSFDLTPAGADPLSVEPAAAEPSSPGWWHLMAFPIALLGFIVAGARILTKWPMPPVDPPAEGQPGRSERVGLRGKLKLPLPSLPATWSFKDSWATNLTVIGALLTGVFGTADVVTAILGKDAKSAIALAVVGSAVATGFVAAGAVVMATLRDGKGKMTAGGLVLASAITTAGAFGQLWVGAWAGLDLDLDGVEYALAVALVLAMALLCLYWRRTFTLTLHDGLEVDDPVDYRKPPLTETMTAAAMIVAALRAKDDRPAVDFGAVLEEMQKATPAAELPAAGRPKRVDHPRQRRHGALF